ncbi:sugar ABC transporter substrate-binding protein [Chelativorans sp. AA-79]|uniref:ABC transporter substrate-binding protein n=1 Tax=Chelativorans sp. AA-79 TaxID=3028735 RepID=UPI0023F8F2E7|nr:sugar ABC transporter substrate-binding protein [Chelativorans sp. AA-79]WEX10961.1 sugar ABC transporter substrate-binding protein [Chelativorans sp. AA-79]
MRKKLFGSVLATAMAVAGASAHAQEVTFMGWVGLFDFQKAGWENIVSSFEEQNPGMTVRYIGTPNEQTLNQAVVAINGGNAPDIIQINPGGVSQLNGMGALADLSGLISEETLAQVPEGYRKAMSFGDRLVALPWIPGPITMVYNRDLMSEAGLDPDSPPRTWAEFTDAVQKICALGDRNGGKVYGVALRSAQQPVTGLWAIPLIWAQGGEVVDEEGRVTFDTPETKAVLGWYRDTINSGCAPEFFDIQQSRNVFGQGRAGFIFEGPWVRGLVENLSGGTLEMGADADVWVADMPSADGNSPRNLDNSNMLVLSENAKDNPAAAAFLEFIVSDPQAVEFFYETSNQLTTSRTDLLNAGKMEEDPYIQAFAATLEHANPLPIRDVQATSMLDALAVAMQSVIKGGDIDAEIANVERTVDRFRD